MHGTLEWHTTKEQAPPRCCGCIPQQGSTLLAALRRLLNLTMIFEAPSLALMHKRICGPCMGPD